MSNYDVSDIKLTSDGDFALDEFNDIDTAVENELIEQMIAICLNSTNPDWGGDTTLAADLEDLLGMPNTRETAESGKKKIIQSLVGSGFFDVDDLYVDAKPYDRGTIMFFLFVHSPFSTEPIGFVINIKLGSSIYVRRAS